MSTRQGRIHYTYTFIKLVTFVRHTAQLMGLLLAGIRGYDGLSRFAQPSHIKWPQGTKATFLAFSRQMGHRLFSSANVICARDG